MSDSNPSISRRRLLVGAGAGTAVIWAAPAISTLGSASAATGSCAKGDSVFSFITEFLSSPPKMPSVNAPSPYVTPGGTLSLTSGLVDLVGSGTSFTASQFPSETSMDLTGTTAIATSPFVTVLTRVGLDLASGAYIAELDYYGSVPGEEPPGNRIEVAIGGVNIIDTGTFFNDTGDPFSASGTLASATGAVTLTHTSSSSDNRGFFLKRLQIFTAIC